MDRLKDYKNAIQAIPFSREVHDSKENYYKVLADSGILGDVLPLTVKKYFLRNDLWDNPIPETVEVGEHKPRFENWKETCNWVEKIQKRKAKNSNSYQNIRVPIKSDKPIRLFILGDTQIGDIGADMSLFKEFTKILLEDDSARVLLVGDLIEMAILRRSIAEINSGSALSPEEQINFMDSWIREIKHKVIGATWDNHSMMREEKAIGYSPFARLLKQHVPYFKGIGHIDLSINDIEYKIACSHRFRGKSQTNRTHAPQRYHRDMANDREIVIQGDYHQYGVSHYEMGGMDRLSIVCGSFQTKSGYAQRHFTLKTHPNMPVIHFGHQEKCFVGFPSVNAYLQATGKGFAGM